MINIGKTSDDFHARFDAKKRTYIYIIKNSEVPLGIEFDNFLWIRSRLNEKQMNKAAKKLLGEQDFSSFRASSCQSNNPVRDMIRIELEVDKFISIRFTANAFLHHMIRNIVGTLLDVGTEKISPKDLIRILQAKDRNAASKTASAEGLYLARVNYPEKYAFPYHSNEMI